MDKAEIKAYLKPQKHLSLMMKNARSSPAVLSHLKAETLIMK